VFIVRNFTWSNNEEEPTFEKLDKMVLIGIVGFR
jgi:hypothetical protein